MPSNIKADNQYFGKFFEQCVVAKINNEAIPEYKDYIFTKEEKEQLEKEAKLIADYLDTNLKATWIGGNTANESGDVILSDGTIIELKRVSSGGGTYFNTSIYYFNSIGFNFKDYMAKYGLYDAIDNIGFKANRQNNSPVSQAISSEIRHNHSEEYNKFVVPTDLIVRKNFLKDLSEFFNSHPDKLYQFYSDMINKTTTTIKKQIPNRYIIFNYANQKITELQISEDKNIQKVSYTNAGMIINDIRIAISWSNGVGLNNPTIRVFF